MKIYALLILLLPATALAQKKTDYYPNGKKMFEGDYQLTWSLDAEETDEQYQKRGRRDKEDLIRLYANISPRRAYDGKCTFYYPDGTKRMEGKYVNGAKQGSFTYWKESGAKDKLVNYKDGMVDGEHTTFGPEGKPYIIGHYKAYNQQQLSEIEYHIEDLMGSKYGTNDMYNMQRREDIRYNSGDTALAAMLSFSDNFEEHMGRFKKSSIWHGRFNIYGMHDGRLKAELNFKDNLKDGRWVVYTPEGKLHFEAMFKDDQLVSARNLIDPATPRTIYSHEGDVNGIDPGILAPPSPDVFKFVEQMPEAPYNVEEYLKNNIKLPKSDTTNYNHRVAVQFVVDEAGNIKDPVVLNAGRVPQPFKDEAIRVIKTMPRWKPGKQNGRPVRVYYNLPIYFKHQ